MAGLVLLAIVVLLVVWAIASYNRLVGMRNQVLNGWRQIDVQLKRRHDLIPNLVNAVRGSMDFERDTLTAVMDARAKALTATGPADAAAEGRAAVAGARAAAGRRRELSDAEVERQREDAAGGTVGDRKQGRFRAAVLQRHRDKFNTAQQVFPDQPVCRRPSASSQRSCSRSPMPADREVPVVDLSNASHTKDTMDTRPIWVCLCRVLKRHESLRSAVREPSPDMADHDRLRRVSAGARGRIRRVLSSARPAATCLSDRSLRSASDRCPRSPATSAAIGPCWPPPARCRSKRWPPARPKATR